MIQFAVFLNSSNVSKLLQVEGLTSPNKIRWKFARKLYWKPRAFRVDSMARIVLMLQPALSIPGKGRLGIQEIKLSFKGLT